jgi:hypothetical protein
MVKPRCWREHSPSHRAAGSKSDIEAYARDGAVVDFRRAARVGRELATYVLMGADNQAYRRAHLTAQQARLRTALSDGRHDGTQDKSRCDQRSKLPHEAPLQVILYTEPCPEVAHSASTQSNAHS